jgi:hypothetical protein
VEVLAGALRAAEETAQAPGQGLGEQLAATESLVGNLEHLCREGIKAVAGS